MNYLSQLIARVSGSADTLSPRAQTLFEPGMNDASAGEIHVTEGLQHAAPMIPVRNIPSRPVTTPPEHEAGDGNHPQHEMAPQVHGVSNPEAMPSADMINQDIQEHYNRPIQTSDVANVWADTTDLSPMQTGVPSVPRLSTAQAVADVNTPAPDPVAGEPPLFHDTLVIKHPASPLPHTDTLRGRRHTTAMNKPVVRQEPLTPEPVINVTIGRIEVRANVQQQAPPKARQGQARGMETLEEYLKRKSAGGTS